MPRTCSIGQWTGVYREEADLGDLWLLKFNLAGLAALQGRSFGGYRTVEGGADTSEVFSFAWYRSAVLGLRAGI